MVAYAFFSTSFYAPKPKCQIDIGVQKGHIVSILLMPVASSPLLYKFIQRKPGGQQSMV